MAARYTVQSDSFVPEKPRVWATKLGAVSTGGDFIDLAPDGMRVAVVTAVETPDAAKTDHEVVFVLNFFDELRRRVPVGRR